MNYHNESKAMTKEQLINDLIQKHGHTSYLEIGTQHGASFNRIKCTEKHTVDPEKQWARLTGTFHHMTSDAFFKRNKRKFDCIFIDGLHHADQVLLDILNAAHVLNDGGHIIVHDLMPQDEESQRVPRVTKMWWGDVWKAWHVLRQRNYDMTMKVHNFDCGVGVIELGQNAVDQMACDFADNLKEIEKLSYDFHFSAAFSADLPTT